MMPSGRHTTTGALDHTLKKKKSAQGPRNRSPPEKKDTCKLQVSTRQKEENGAPHFGIF